MKVILIMLVLCCTGWRLHAQVPICTGEESLIGSWQNAQQTLCYHGMGVRLPLPATLSCKCLWEWKEIHPNDVPCYPFEGLQLIYEDHFQEPKIMRKPYTAPNMSYDQQVIYRDWRPGYGYNGANAKEGEEYKASWDDDTACIHVGAGNLSLTAKKLSAPQHNVNYQDGTSFDTPWLGGTIVTQDKWGYGAFEIRCKMAADPEGLNQAFWLVGGTTSGCTQEEIDVFETFDDHPNPGPIDDINPFKEQKNRRILTTIYSSPCDADADRCQRQFHSKLPVFQQLSDWHTYKLYWTPYETTFYIDGRFIYKMFSHGMGLWQTNPIQQGQGCAFMSFNANIADMIAASFPPWFPEALIPKYHVKRFKTYPRAENSTLSLLVQNQIRVNHGSHTNLPQDFTVDYVKVWQFGQCGTDVYKSGTFSVGCDKNVPYVNYHMGKVITYGTDFVLSAANVCHPTDENLNFQNERLMAVASDAIILEAGTTIEFGTKFETRIEPCQSIDAGSALPQIGGFLRTDNSTLPGSYQPLRDTIINGQMALYTPDPLGNSTVEDRTEIMAQVNPNPASDELTLESSLTSGRYEIVGMMGEKLASGNITGQRVTIPISSLQDGCYWLWIYNRDIVKQLRFIKISKP